MERALLLIALIGCDAQSVPLEGNPGQRLYTASESCDGTDEDGDGLVDEGEVCPCDREEVDGVTYLLCTDPLAWEDAALECAEMGYELATVRNAAENLELSALTRSAARYSSWWLGYNDISNEDSWQTTMGESARFTRWYHYQPDNRTSAGFASTKGADCAVLGYGTFGRWADEACSDVRPYVCEVGDDLGEDTGDTGIEDEELCNALDDDADGLIDEAGCPCNAAADADTTTLYCETNVTAADAAQQCETWGYRLAVANSPESMEELAETAASFRSFAWWIGLSDSEEEGTFTYTDGTTAEEANWYRYQPDDGGGSGEDCVRLNYGGTGTLADEACEDQAAFICTDPTAEAPLEPDWAYAIDVELAHDSSADGSESWSRFTLDTAALITAGTLQPDGADLRIYEGSVSLDYWLETTTLNTAATGVWVRLPAADANATTTLVVLHGNEDAERASLAWHFDSFDTDTSSLYSTHYARLWDTPTWTWQSGTLSTGGSNMDSFLAVDGLELGDTVYVELVATATDDDSTGPALLGSSTHTAVVAAVTDDYNGAANRSGESLVAWRSQPTRHRTGVSLLDVGNVSSIRRQWTTVGLWFDGSDLSLYIDGTEEGGVAYTDAPFAEAGIGSMANQHAQVGYLWVGASPIDFDPSALTSTSVATVGDSVER